VVLDPARLRDWLNLHITDRAQLRAVTHRLPSDRLKAVTVSTDVNNTKNDSPHLIKRWGQTPFRPTVQ
jgi:putative SOS response-associated peptidase YedK